MAFFDSQDLVFISGASVSLLIKQQTGGELRVGVITPAEAFATVLSTSLGDTIPVDTVCDPDSGSCATEK